MAGFGRTWAVDQEGPWVIAAKNGVEHMMEAEREAGVVDCGKTGGGRKMAFGCEIRRLLQPDFATVQPRGNFFERGKLTPLDRGMMQCNPR